MPELSTSTMRLLQPYAHVYAYYDGRIAGKRLYSEAPNWVDDGAYSLGIASYAVVSGDEALVYDTHVSLAHARRIRQHLEALGVRQVRVTLSHWHDDHVAGNSVFSDCEIIALKATAEALSLHAEALQSADPPISPLVMPNRLFEGSLRLRVGNVAVELLAFDIHTADGTVLWLPDSQLLLAGDTLEDTVTFIAEPEHLATHVRELDRLSALPIKRILPNHGSERKVAAGGYETSFIGANQAYLRRLLDGDGLAASLKDFVAPELASGAISYFEAYEPVHAQNVAAVQALAKR